MSRKDSKGRVLHTGEYQRACDNIYIFRYKTSANKWHSIYAGSLALLREKERKIVADLIDGIDVENAKYKTLNDVFDEYINGKMKIKKQTKDQYNHTYNRYVRETIGQSTIASFKYSDIRNFYIALMNDYDLQTGTIKNVHHLLYPVFRIAVRDSLIRTNPAETALADLESETTEREPLSLEEQKVFLDLLDNTNKQYFVPLLKVLIGTGCRISEAISLRWCDVDFDKRVIQIRHTFAVYIENGKKRIHVSTPKSKNSLRCIPMMDIVYDTLKQEYRRQECEGFYTYEVDGVKGFIFGSRRNGPINCSCVNRAIKNMIGKYNKRQSELAEEQFPFFLPPITCHTLRHTFCSRLCEQNVNLKMIQEIMGHSSIQTTMDIYTKLDNSKKVSDFNEIQRNII